MGYERLLMDADKHGITVLEVNLKANDGLIYDDLILIDKKLRTYREKSCVLAEEIGHFETSVGDIINQAIAENRKQEYRARLWAYDKQVGLMGLVNAFNSGCHSFFEMSEFLDVTEEFLTDAINCYRSKYGLFTTLDNYVIYFDPFGIFKKF